MTMNGRVAAGRSTPSTVTWRSSMHSSSADWVLGEARLISSPTTMLAKIGAGLELELAPLLVVDADAGDVAGQQVRGELDAPHRAVDGPGQRLGQQVLPTPGTSSMSRWPSASSTVSASRTASGLPTTTVLIASLIRWATGSADPGCHPPARSQQTRVLLVPAAPPGSGQSGSAARGCCPLRCASTVVAGMPDVTTEWPSVHNELSPVRPARAAPGLAGGFGRCPFHSPHSAPPS